MQIELCEILSSARQVLYATSGRYRARCDAAARRVRVGDGDKWIEQYFDLCGWDKDNSSLVQTWMIDTPEARAQRDLPASAEAVAADSLTHRAIPTAAHSEFQSPRLVRLRGLDFTLSPRLLPIPTARSCR